MKATCMLLLLFFSIKVLAQSNTFELKGQILNEKGRYMPLVNVTLRTDSINTSELFCPSKSQGNFNFKNLKLGKYILEARFVGYKSFKKRFTLRKSSYIAIRLYPTFETLDEVVIITPRKKIKKDPLSKQKTVPLHDQLIGTLDFLSGISWFGTGFTLAQKILEGQTLNRIVIIENELQQIPIHWGLDWGREFDRFGVEGLDYIIGPNGYEYGPSSGARIIRLKQQFLPPPLSLQGNVVLSTRSDNKTRGLSIVSTGRTNDFFVKGRASIHINKDSNTNADKLYVGTKVIPINSTLQNTAKTEWSMMLICGLMKDWGRSQVTIKNTFRQQGFFPATYHATPIDYQLDDDISNISIPYYNALNLHIVNNSKIYIKNGSLMVDVGFQLNENQNWSKRNWFNLPDIPQINEKYNLELKNRSKNISATIRYEKMHGKRNTLKIGTTSYSLWNKIDGFSYLIPKFQQANIGIFGREHLFLNDKFKITIGGRYDCWWLRTEETFENFITTQSNTISTETNPSFLTKTNRHGFSFSIASNYNSSKLTLDLVLGKNLRLPTISELHSNGYNARTFRYEIGNAQSRLEKSYFSSLNGAFNNNLLASKLFVKYSIFQNYLYPLLLNEKHEAPNTNQIPITKYIETKAKALNVMADISCMIHPKLRLKTIGKITIGKTVKQKSNYYLPMQPPAQFISEFSYLSKRNWTIFSNMFAGIQLEKGFRQKRISPNEKETPSYTTLNFALGSNVNIGIEKLRIELQWKNLLNKQYFDHTKFHRLIGMTEPCSTVFFTVNLPFIALGKQ